MGEVYRARDTHLNRDVAIKVLPELFAVDAERIARFTREAQLRARIAGSEARLLQGTVDPLKPFWPPDSKSIGFGAQGKLKRVEIAGGPPTTLADAARLNSDAWHSSGVILFAPDYNAGILQVSSKGGEVKRARICERAAAPLAFRKPIRPRL